MAAFTSFILSQVVLKDERGGDGGVLNTVTPQKNNEHRITARKVNEARHRNTYFVHLHLK